MSQTIIAAQYYIILFSLFFHKHITARKTASDTGIITKWAPLHDSLVCRHSATSISQTLSAETAFYYPDKQTETSQSVQSQRKIDSKSHR